MSVVPDAVDANRQPPMTVPLRHFVVGFGFLFGAVLVGTDLVAGIVPGVSRLAHLHLLLVGWVCVTIMGAMTQFVPVWSGTTLHSHRLASLQLLFVAVGVTGFALGFVAAEYRLLIFFGAAMLTGFWLFVYNIGRTLLTVDRYDVTERHFLYSLGFFLLLTTFGFLLAVNFTYSILGSLPVTYTGLVGAHATLAVFGAVLTTVYGALYQLATMFTQTELHGVDHHLQSIEEFGHPVGVLLLAGGRLTDTGAVARIGGIFVLLAAVAVALVLGRKLREMRVDWTPMHSRYTVLAGALAGWAVLSVPAWLKRPTARQHLLGGPEAVPLLLFGVIGFVVLGTLYHIVPFIIWVHRYSDRLGFEDVPMIDDLYSGRLAAIDFTLLVGGTVLLVAGQLWTGRGFGTAGTVSLGLGVVVFTTNMLLVIHRHSPHTLDQVLFGSLTPRRAAVDTRP